MASIRKRSAPEKAQDAFFEAISNKQIRTSPVIRLEMTWGARTKQEAEEKEKRLSVPELALTPDIIERTIRGLTSMIAEPHPIKRVPIPDALLAATAQAHGIGVLHYDQDFDVVARFFEIPTTWIAPRGSIQ